MWSSNDEGDSWSMTQRITSESARNHNYARRPIDAADPFHVFWADGDPMKLSESHLYFANSLGTKVWKLPYVMKGDWAEPELVDHAKLK